MVAMQHQNPNMYRSMTQLLLLLLAAHRSEFISAENSVHFQDEIAKGSFTMLQFPSRMLPWRVLWVDRYTNGREIRISSVSLRRKRKQEEQYTGVRDSFLVV